MGQHGRVLWGRSAAGRRVQAWCWVLVAGIGMFTPAAVPGDVARGDNEPPLPTTDEVLTGLGAQVAREQDYRQTFAERYTHVRTWVREERSPGGKLRLRIEEREVHDPTDSAFGDPDGPSAQGRGSRYTERDFQMSEELLRRFIFEVEAREEFDGRGVVRVSFRPAPGDLPQHGLLDRFINRTAGTLWLDESSYMPVKARVALIEEVSFLAGIAGVVHSLNAVWERAVTPEGLWYTRHSAWRVDFRQFLVRKVVDFEERRDEVRRIESAPELGTG